uniref:peptidylprolyl isomerase n=1 Tax=Alexandrium catenella TaxID=2925 RepID=A0A7S1WVI8_ALECA|mmetsp:Transcript_92573/g.245898  ORF Transcript_92573/g.245898 Transcript_92573/m.245898 type:complete len:393 (+) Transcript_92573:60-1238(+)|eukprot:CAMPEP_0171187758 /NCGR_PEP_ID=MMETSP0790-20130122/17484_1 /TAXON_ID=2925 /ORGANISM="Alexandrium catenella, Strain OF101" /LENGTH=392 /DNA_ID=CAMNT_0011652825 /DNA_START=59 /DNA_END=1237 /DNA_ORIENTATION=+
MAGSWRVVVEEARELDAPAYRAGDLARGLMKEDVKIKNAVVQLSLSGKGDPPPSQITKPFDVDESGCAKIEQVLFVPRPSGGQTVLIRVVKPHKVQKDALIGEVEVQKPSGKVRLPLTRGGKTRGYLLVSITDGIPVPPPQLPPQPGGRGSSSSGWPSMPPTNSRSSAASTGPRRTSTGQMLPAPTAFNYNPAKSTAFGGTAAAASSATTGSNTGERNAVANVQSGATSCLQGILACGQGLMTKGMQVAGEVSFLQPIIAALGLQDQRGFLERKAAEPGVLRRPSGLLYRIKRNGHGKHHPAEDMPCDCHYRGRLINGKEFDSSYRDGKPARYMPREVIKGWSEAIQLMVEGDVWELFIPPELAYGDRGVAGIIPGGAVLIFEVELIKVRSR